MFRPYEKVLCIDDSGFNTYDRLIFSALPRRDQVYTVREFREHDGVDGVLLAEITGEWSAVWHCEYGFKAARFRKLAATEVEAGELVAVDA